MRKKWKQWQTLFSWAPKSLGTMTAAIKLKDACSLGKKAMTNLNSVLKSRDITLLTKICIVKAMAFLVVIQMWELDHKEVWAPKSWCSWIVVLEKTLESPLDCKVIKPVNPKGNQPWIFTGKTDAKAEAPILWPLDAKTWLNEKTLALGRIRGWRRRGNGGWDGWTASLTQWRWVSLKRPWRWEGLGAEGDRATEDEMVGQHH